MYPQHFKIKLVRANRKNYASSATATECEPDSGTPSD